jgi:outer membrane protein assembly factor BamB
MKQPKTLFLVAIALLPLVLVSCSSIFGGAPVSRGWAGTAFRDGIIYAGSRDGRVVAINSSTQSPQWDYAFTSTAIYTTPIVDGDLVYVGTYSGKVLALNTLARSQNLTFPQARYGEWKWDCPIDNAKSNAIVADLAISEDALYVASSNGRVYSLDKGSGDENWKREDIPVLAEKLWTSPVIQGDTLYVSTFDGHIYALSVETGELLDWSFESEAGFASSPVIYEDTIYVGSFDNKLCAIRIGGSEPLWEFPGGKWFWAAPVVGNGTLYAGCLDGKLYAIEAETGEKVWEFDVKSPIVSSPVLMDNLLIVANEAGNVYVINPETGEGERIRNPENDNKPTINAQIKASLCAHEGLVYIRGEDNWIYVADIDKGELSWKVSLTIEE